MDCGFEMLKVKLKEKYPEKKSQCIHTGWLLLKKNQTIKQVKFPHAIMNSGVREEYCIMPMRRILYNAHRHVMGDIWMLVKIVTTFTYKS